MDFSLKLQKIRMFKNPVRTVPAQPGTHNFTYKLGKTNFTCGMTALPRADYLSDVFRCAGKGPGVCLTCVSAVLLPSRPDVAEANSPLNNCNAVCEHTLSADLS